MTTDVLQLVRISRGVRDPEHTAEFYGRLLDLVPERVADGLLLSCANGELIFHNDVSIPVAFELNSSKASFEGQDPDGVPVAAASGLPSESVTCAVMLDHVRLNCADLPEAIRFYRELGFALTWSGFGGSFVDGAQDEPIPGATWAHLSGSDGYLSLSQADWQDYGTHSTASGPPRFIHIGLAVEDMARIATNLDDIGISYDRSQSPLGERMYLNDTDGILSLGMNVELNQYEPGVPRSGRWP